LAAKGIDVGKVNLREIEPLVPEAMEILGKFDVDTPVDLAYQDGKRVEARVGNLPDNKIMDIGKETVEKYSAVIENADAVIANGPCGVIETDAFALGTFELMKRISKSRCLSVVGGGHLGAIAKRLNLKNIFISTGGKAMLSFLAGDKLPGIETLRGEKHD
jgi:phosphoglycerate kinase